MSPRIGTRATWIIGFELVLAVHHLVTVGEHAGCQGDLFGRKSVKLRGLQTGIFIAQRIGDSERQRSVAARGEIFTLPCHCAEESGDVKVRVDEDLSAATELLRQESAEGQADDEIRTLVTAYSFKKVKSLARVNGNIRSDDLAALQKNPQGGRHLVGSGGGKSVDEKDFHRKLNRLALVALNNQVTEFL